MTPLAPSGTTGYPDWQRVSNYDSGILWSDDTGVTNATVQSPVLDVQRYALLSGLISCVTGQVLVTLQWYPDDTGSILNQLQTQEFVMSALVAEPAMLNVLNLGPFVQVTLTAIGGANYRVAARLFASNRQNPLPAAPIFPLMVDVPTQALGAGLTTKVYPLGYFAGPVQVFISVPAVTWGWGIEYMFTDGTWHSITGSGTGSTPLLSTQVLIVPLNAWRLSVTNASGAGGNFSATITQTTTGST